MSTSLGKSVGSASSRSAQSTSATRVPLFPAAELPAGASRVVEVEGRSIGVFNVGGRYHALRNVCPHKLAPLCVGPTCGLALGERPGEARLERDGEIVRCPWHGWEFEIATGKSVFNPHRVRVKSYAVQVEPFASGGEAAPAFAEDPKVEGYPVEIEAGWAVLYLR